MRSLRGAVLALGLVAASADAQCIRNCFYDMQHKPSSVIPADRGTLNAFGDGFTNTVNRLQIAGNGFAQVSLGFTLNIGTTSFNSVFVSENGALSFGAPIVGAVQTLGDAAAVGGSFVPVRASLSELRVPVIAPFYADLAESTDLPNDTGPHVGEIFYQYGVADPTPDANGNYSFSEALNAVRITWYGLNVLAGSGGGTATDEAATASQLAWAQVLITDEGRGDFNFEFRTGDPAQAGPPYSQPGLGSLAGFALPGGSRDFRGNPNYDNGTPSYFAFRGGVLVTAVPEPATWGMMIAGFALAGATLRQRRRVVSRAGFEPATY